MEVPSLRRPRQTPALALDAPTHPSQRAPASRTCVLVGGQATPYHGHCASSVSLTHLSQTRRTHKRCLVPVPETHARTPATQPRTRWSLWVSGGSRVCTACVPLSPHGLPHCPPVPPPAQWSRWQGLCASRCRCQVPGRDWGCRFPIARAAVEPLLSHRLQGQVAQLDMLHHQRLARRYVLKEILSEY